MWLTKVPFAIISGSGLGILLAAGYFIIRGPFLGGQPLSNMNLMVAVAAFFVGIFVFSWGASRLMGIGTRM